MFTFDPTPAVLFGLSDGKELTTREEKRRLFERLGIDTLIEFPLTKETAATEPERFATEILAKQMNTRFVAARICLLARTAQEMPNFWREWRRIWAFASRP